MSLPPVGSFFSSRLPDDKHPMHRNMSVLIQEIEERKDIKASMQNAFKRHEELMEEAKKYK